MTMTETLRVVVFKDGEAWIAQALEHDICVQAVDLVQLQSRFEMTLEAEIEHSGGDLSALSAAPQEFQDMWEGASGSFQPRNQNPNFEMALCA